MILSAYIFSVAEVFTRVLMGVINHRWHLRCTHTGEFAKMTIDYGGWATGRRVHIMVTHLEMGRLAGLRWDTEPKKMNGLCCVGNAHLWNPMYIWCSNILSAIGRSFIFKQSDHFRFPIQCIIRTSQLLAGIIYVNFQSYRFGWFLNISGNLQGYFWNTSCILRYFSWIRLRIETDWAFLLGWRNGL